MRYESRRKVKEELHPVGVKAKLDPAGDGAGCRAFNGNGSSNLGTSLILPVLQQFKASIRCNMRLEVRLRKCYTPSG